jgi:nucleoside-diphosphate-sugar epimerase
MLTATKDVDYVFHLAAMSTVKECEENPNAAEQINVDGTRNVLEACRKNKVSWMLFPSSSHVYGEVEELPLRETSPLRTSSKYAETKISAERLCEEYRKYFPITVMRIFNIYGPGQKDRVIPDFIEKARNGAITIWGDGKQTLDFVYIKDVISAFLLAMGKRDSDTYNLASGTEIELNELAKTVAEVVERDVRVQHDLSKSRGPLRIVSDISKIKRNLEWEPKFSLKQGIKTCL